MPRFKADPGAWQELSRIAHASARKVLDSRDPEADDVAQETLLRILERADPDRGAPGGLAKVAAYRLAIDVTRRRKRERPSAAVPERTEQATNPTRDGMREALAQALLELPAPARMLLVVARGLRPPEGPDELAAFHARFGPAADPRDPFFADALLRELAARAGMTYAALTQALHRAERTLAAATLRAFSRHEPEAAP
jgi:hypothetical protein